MATSTQSQQWSDLCMEASLAATECADWCIQNGMPGDHIRLCLDTSTIAAATARVMEREGEYMAPLLDACVGVLKECAASCERHEESHESMERCRNACTQARDAVQTVAKRQGNQRADAGGTKISR